MGIPIPKFIASSLSNATNALKEDDLKTLIEKVNELEKEVKK